MKIKINYKRDELLDPYAITILKDRYMVDGEASPQDAFARAAMAFADDEAHAQRLYDYVSKLWFMFSTPVLANGGTKRGLPISCFLNYVGDSRDSILKHYEENGWLASSGGGLGGYWGSLRTSGTKTSTGGESTGMIPFLKVVDDITLAFRQGGTRRAAYAAYLDIDHPEIIEFLNMRKPTGGDVNRKCLNLHHGINITDKFMSLIEECTLNPETDDTWELIDPHTKDVSETVSAKDLWQSILELRVQTGEPYIHFIDTTNKYLPSCQKALGLKVHGSNLCSEIVLPTNSERTAVCCLSSLNLEKYEEWKDTTIVQDLVRMLDNVLDAFIQMPHMHPSGKDAIRKAVNSATQERSLGLGAMGFHAYLQSKMIPFESDEAVKINKEMFQGIRTMAERESKRLGVEKGVAPDFGDLSNLADAVNAKRNVHLMAIAPNASSSIICGNTSPSIEPYNGNAFAQKTENGTNIYKNKFLEVLLSSKGLSKAKQTDIWKQIASNNGSVSSVEELTEEEKEVFKTAFEVSPFWIVRHAADRQVYIDQAQSVNLFFRNPVNLDLLHKVHLHAWKSNLKTLYYCRSMKSSRTENIGTRFDRFDIEDKTAKKFSEVSNQLELTGDFKQTQFKTILPNGMEVGCIGCE